MEWQLWLILIIVTSIILNVIISYYSYKLDIHEIMMSIKESDVKTNQYIFCFCFISIITLISEAFKLFESDIYVIIYFSLIIVFSTILTKLTKFIMAIDMKKSGVKLFSNSFEKIEEPKKTIFGLLPFAFFLAVFLGISEASNENSKR